MTATDIEGASRTMTDPASAPAPQVPKAAELVAAALRRQIVMGERAEGELLPPELKLMTELGVSRPTLRQALRILENERLVRIHRGRNGGARVSRPSVTTAGRHLNNLLLFQGATLDDVHTARLLLEPAAVAGIAGKVSPADIASLRAAVAQSRTGSDPARRRIGSDFHVRLVELTGNRSLALFARLISGLLDGAIERHDAERRKQHAPSQAGELIDDHERIIDLIEAGASREAARHWREHLETVHQNLRKTIDTQLVLDMEH